jgi:hypothetical protein
MANPDSGNPGEWIDERLRALTVDERPVDAARARQRLHEVEAARQRRNRQLLIGAAGACLLLLMLPWPRALAHQLWDFLVIERVQVLHGGGEDLPESVTAGLMMEAQGIEQSSVRDEDEVERLAGFRPSLPPPGLLKGAPRLSIVKSVTLATRPLNTAAVQQALTAAGIADIRVPKEWEGVTLSVEAGPVVIAEYEDVEISQSEAFKLHMPAGFQFRHFMEMAFRLFGQSSEDAIRLSQKLETNPALVMHFPKDEPVRDFPSRVGQVSIVGRPDGPDGICIFWNTADRIYVVSARHMSYEKAVALANAMQ